MGKKIAGWLIVALIVYYVVSAPADAAATGNDALSGAKSAGDSLITFLKALSK